MKKAAIIGGGEIGRAISAIIRSNGITVSVWDKNPAVSEEASEEAAIIGAQAVFFCVPSWYLRDAIVSAGSKMTGDEIVVFVSKGLEKGTGHSSLQMADEMLARHNAVFVGGPMIAEEISKGMGGAAVVASRDAASAMIIRDALSSPSFSAIVGSDPQGVVLSGVLKNVYAMLIGASEGLGYGVNVKGWLLSESMAEMARIVGHLGGKEGTAYGPAGLGDLVATGSGSFSSNWRSGFDLASGKTPSKVSEGMSSLPELLKKLPNASEHRYISAVWSIMGGLDPKEVFKGILSSK